MWWLQGIGAMGLFDLAAASDQTILKSLIVQTSPLFLLAIRLLTGGGCISIRCFWAGIWKNVTMDRHFIEHVLKGAFFRTFLPNLLGYWALQYMPVAKALLFFNLRLFASYFLSHLLLQESITWRKSIAVAISFASCIPLFVAKISIATNSQENFTYSLLLPEIASAIAMLIQSYGWIEMRRMRTLHPYIPYLAVNGLEALIAGILATLSLSILQANTVAYFVTTAYSRSFIGWFSFSVFLGVVLTLPLYSNLLQHYSETLLSVATRFIPLVSALIAWFYLGESVSWDFFLSFFLALLGFWMFHQEEMYEKQVVKIRKGIT